MALDVYVMPLWRFKSGDFTSPIEETLGIKPTVISLADPLPAPEPPWYLRILEKTGFGRKASAKKEVRSLKQQLTKMTGTTVDWPDTGLIHYNKQFHHPVTLRAFAAWLDHRETLPEFVRVADGNYYKHPVWQIAKPPHRRFSTLIQHSMHSGYFLPVPFEGVHLVEPYSAWGFEFHHHVASTQTIVRELSELLPLFDAIPVTEGEGGSNPVAAARWYAEELQRICNLSLEHCLPVIFYG